MHRSRVLVADDEPEIRTLVSALLTHAGHHVTTVGCGWSLVEGGLADRPDLVVSDITMPNLDGLSAATTLLAEMQVPFVLMSGSWTREQWEMADTLGAIPLTKPFTGDQLLEAVEKALLQIA
jgi:CheY-like chemotaxis protein